MDKKMLNPSNIGTYICGLFIENHRNMRSEKKPQKHVIREEIMFATPLWRTHQGNLVSSSRETFDPIQVCVQGMELPDVISLFHQIAP